MAKPKPTKVFSSVKDAWHGILSGSVVPTSTTARRRVSCSAITLPTYNTKRTSTQETSASADGASSAKDDDVDDILNNIDALDDDLEDSDDEYECSVFVATASSANDQQVDLSALSDEDLRRLKRDDPFLYFSIPSVRRGSLLCNANEENNILSDISRPTSGSSSRRRSSMPAEALAMADINVSRTRRRRSSLLDDCPTIEESIKGTVRRDRRHSTECHPTIICEELMAELEQELVDEMGGGIGGMEDDATIDEEFAALERELMSLG